MFRWLQKTTTSCCWLALLAWLSVPRSGIFKCRFCGSEICLWSAGHFPIRRKNALIFIRRNGMLEITSDLKGSIELKANCGISIAFSQNTLDHLLILPGIKAGWEVLLSLPPGKQWSALDSAVFVYLWASSQVIVYPFVKLIRVKSWLRHYLVVLVRLPGL